MSNWKLAFEVPKIEVTNEWVDGVGGMGGWLLWVGGCYGWVEWRVPGDSLDANDPRLNSR